MTEPRIASIHAEPGPVFAYAAYMKEASGQDRAVVAIPEGTLSHKWGFRYTTTLKGEDLNHFLSRGATLVEKP